MATKKGMSESAKQVLNFLKKAGVGSKFTCNEIKDALGFEKIGSVTGSIRGLVTKEYVDRFVETSEPDEKGKTTEIKKFALNEKGMAFDPDAVTEE